MAAATASLGLLVEVKSKKAAAAPAPSLTRSKSRRRRRRSSSASTSESNPSTSPAGALSPNTKRRRKKRSRARKKCRAALCCTQYSSKNGHLLTKAQVPEFLQFNPFIATGFRPVCGDDNCWAHGHVFIHSLLSVFTWHNETLNIWLHLIGLIATGLYSAWEYYAPSPEMGFRPHVFWAVFSFVIVYTGSVVYHSAMCACKTKHQYECILKCDVFCVLVGMTVSGVCSILSGYRCCPESIRQLLAGVFVGNMLLVFRWLTCETLSVRARFWTVSIHIFLRLFLVVGLAIPAAYYHGLYSAILWHLTGFLVMVMGGVINTLRLPERWLDPGTVDMFGNSHQVWHFFTLLVSYVTYKSIASDHAQFVHPDVVASCLA